MNEPVPLAEAIIRKTAMKCLEPVEAAIRSFDRDPPDSDFQRGYLAALRDVHESISRAVLSVERPVS